MTTVYKKTLSWHRQGRALWNVIARQAVPREDVTSLSEPRLGCCKHFSSHQAKKSVSVRRKRQFKSYFPDEPADPFSPNFGRMQQPYQPGEKDMAAYLNKTALSPWVPLSDAICRKLFDLAQAGPDDIHVDLGCGDGRVNFHAIQYGVKQSTGIDVDEGIIDVAKDRLSKRHPPPPLSFIVADLLDESHPAWGIIQEATLITMYFADPGLEALRPLLERKLRGKRCKIITAGYEMPDWQYFLVEVIMGTKLYLYEWGKPVTDENDIDVSVFIRDNILGKPVEEVTGNRFTFDKFEGAKMIDRTPSDPIYDGHESDDDESWYEAFMDGTLPEENSNQVDLEDVDKKGQRGADDIVENTSKDSRIG